MNLVEEETAKCGPSNVMAICFSVLVKLNRQYTIHTQCNMRLLLGNAPTPTIRCAPRNEMMVF